MTTTRTITVFVPDQSKPYWKFVETVTAPKLHTLVYELDYGWISFHTDVGTVVVPAHRVTSVMIGNETNEDTDKS